MENKQPMRQVLCQLKLKLLKKAENTRVDKSYEKYAKYNVAAKTLCVVCGNEKMKCTCKKNRSTSVSITLNKRSDNMTGKMDLTPKVKVDLNPEKNQKAVQQQRRIREEDKKRKEKRFIKTEETTKTHTKEENYTYDKKKEREIHDEDLCHCGDENCPYKEEIAKKKKTEDMMKKRRIEELKRAKLMEDQRLKKNRRRANKKTKIEEGEKRRRRR